jgi:hypothetical protein
LADSFGMKLHFMPVTKPAPPRPRSPEALTISTIASGAIDQALRPASYPPVAMYSSIVRRVSPFGGNR